MDLSEKQLAILNGKICPYCRLASEFVDSKVIYGKSYGMVYLCKPCDAYVGVHEGGSKALGRLANRELRIHKKEAHKYFDPLWKSGPMERTEAYKWLSEKLELPPKFTHIGMFSAATCENVIFYSKQLLNDLRRLDIDCGTTPKTEYLK